MKEPGTLFYQLSLVVLSVYVLAAPVAAESFGDLNPETQQVLYQYVDLQLNQF